MEQLGTQIVGTNLDYGIMLVYVLALVAFGSMFGKFTKSTKDFFMAGQRFPWWLVAMSAVATTVGSYSFIKYAAAGYNYGICSSQTYMNDFFLIPLWLFTWLPIIYFARVTSIPEYLERRFNRTVRSAAVVVMMLYLVGYIGINLYTMGTAARALVGWPVFPASIIIAVVTASYVVIGGQTSVIMTDLLQGFILLGAGFLLFILGISWMGKGGGFLAGLTTFWQGLAPAYRAALPAFNTPHKFNFVGIFWQDAIASTGAFYFMNQGLMLRYLSLKSVKEGRKAVLAILLILMPLATFAVCNAGWLGRAMVAQGLIKAPANPNDIFVVVANIVCQPGIFGFVMAALMAALMSTADTLINAASAIFVNDIWKPFFRSEGTEKHYLSVARWSSVGITLAGILLVPLFMQFKSIYVAHGSFTAAVTPPMIVTIIFAAFWKRYHSKAAFWTLVGGTFVTFLSIAFPGLIGHTLTVHNWLTVKFFALVNAITGWALPTDVTSIAVSAEGGYKYMRALFSLLASGVIGVFITFALPKDKNQDEKIRGLTAGTLEDAKIYYKRGGKPNERESKPARASLIISETATKDKVTVSRAMAERIRGLDGDLVFVEDARWWLGGLRGIQTYLCVADGPKVDEVLMHPTMVDEGNFLSGRPVKIEKLI